jgi:hypothetical protein
VKDPTAKGKPSLAVGGDESVGLRFVVSHVSPQAVSWATLPAPAQPPNRRT